MAIGSRSGISDQGPNRWPLGVYVSKRIHFLKLLRKGYKNWVRIALSYFLARDKPVDIVPRIGKPIESVSIRDLSNVVAFPKLLANGWLIKRDDAEHVLCEKSGVRIRCRIKSGADIAHLVTIFIEKEYGTDFNDKVIIDVGASNGDSSIYFALGGAKKVFGVEPSSNSFQLARENVSLNGLGNKVILLNLALSSGRGTAELWLSSSSPNADTLNPTSTARKINVFDSRIMVDALSVNDILRDFGLDRINFLKVDCEGCEYGLIRNLSGETLKQIDQVAMEFHDGAQDLPNILEMNDFQVNVPKRGTRLGYLYAVRHERALG